MDLRTTTALLYLDDISVSFDGFRALNKLSLVIEPGEMRAIIGPNGAGKTTMMDVITGKTKPDAGDVMFNGNVDLTRLDPLLFGIEAYPPITRLTYILSPSPKNT
jgi:urea transport system ATP-binding protein